MRRASPHYSEETVTGEWWIERDANDEHRGRDQRDDEEAPVDRRVVEDRVDAEESLEDVALVQLRVLEDGLGLVLVEAHDGEDERHRHELAVEDPDSRPLPG